MSDKITDIYNALKANPTISAKCGNRIKFYDYPEIADTSKAFMIIAPLDVPSALFYASNREMMTSFEYQIDVQSPSRLEVKEIQVAVKKTLREEGFNQLPAGLDTYFTETKRYVDARRYTGNSKMYETDY